MTLDNQFNSITNKLQQLLKQQGRLKKENERLRQEQQEFQKKEKAYRQYILEMEHRLSIMQLAAGELSEKDKKEFERKLNQYIKEIEKCIAFLGQL